MHDIVLGERSTTDRILRALVYAILIGFVLFYLAPLYVMVVTSVKSLEEILAGGLLNLPKKLDFYGWDEAWNNACVGTECRGMAPFMINSLIASTLATIIPTAIGALNGYALSLWRFKGSELFFGMLLFGAFIPFQIVLLPMASFLGWIGWSSSLTGLTFTYIVYGLPFTTLYFRNFFVSFPIDLVNAAKIDGIGYFRFFWRVALPSSVPIMIVSVIWQFTNTWNDFLFASTMTKLESATVMVALNNFVEVANGVKRYNVDMAAAIIAGLPTLVVYLVAGRYFLRGLMAGAVKG
ncbi:glucose/mannose transport system permease protein [Aliiruegeria haliotis]|uniref:Glucose/mannose transport system permease protein n=1 Tax=Aliiruegeria haliotis TaxID=1280846 RepID=A0A2T0RMP1_9RHOB|nr:carbohydrate ABC transporter permease [Aliiruegeria haliotis]PRY22466.1 glucose/mannose transport system permease protein [Aliiruegeria haliotis]